MMVVTLNDLAPERTTKFDESVMAEEQTVINETVIGLPATSGGSESWDTEQSAFEEPAPESGQCNVNRFMYGTDNTYNRMANPNATTHRGGDFWVSFLVDDRGLLTDGYKVYIEAQDWQGNRIAVEHEGILDKTFAQKVLDVVTRFLEQVAAAATAFLSWVVEAIGPIVGLILGLLVGLAKSIVDAIIG